MVISGDKSYDIYQHFSTPSPLLGIIIEENAHNYGWPLTHNYILQVSQKVIYSLHCNFPYSLEGITPPLYNVP